MKLFQYVIILSLLVFPTVSNAGSLTLTWENPPDSNVSPIRELKIFRGGSANCPLPAALPQLLNGLGGIAGTPVLIVKPVLPATLSNTYIDLQVPDTQAIVCYEMSTVLVNGSESPRSKRKMILFNSSIIPPDIQLIE